MIGAGSSVTAGGNISVVSSDVIDANILSGTVAIGGTAGVGVGIAVSVLYSNVVAEVENGATLAAGGSILVNAASGSVTHPLPSTDNYDGKGDGAIYDKAVGYITPANAKAESDGASSGDTSSIRMITVTAGGGYVGVNVAAAVLVTFATARGDHERQRDRSAEPHRGNQDGLRRGLHRNACRGRRLRGG